MPIVELPLVELVLGDSVPLRKFHLCDVHMHEDICTVFTAYTELVSVELAVMSAVWNVLHAY